MTADASLRSVKTAAGINAADASQLRAEKLLPLVYDELRQLAQGYLRHEGPGHTLGATALVHEAYLKLAQRPGVDWQGRTHFFAVSARVMRRLLVDHARGRRRLRRGGDWQRVTLNESLAPEADPDLDPAQLLSLDAALAKLAGLDERQAQIVELRFFSGLTVGEIAGYLGVSERTVAGDWSFARTWLRREILREV